MHRRFSVGRAAAAKPRPIDSSRGRPLQPVPEHVLEVRLEASSAAGQRLLDAIEQGTREFILTSRDGRTSAAVRLALAGASVTEHRMAGQLVSIDWGRSTVQCRLDRVSLSRTELRLLAALIEATGRPLSRPELISKVWPHNAAETMERGNALAVYICTLRKRLAAIGLGSALQTMRGVGYHIVT